MTDNDIRKYFNHLSIRDNNDRTVVICPAKELCVISNDNRVLRRYVKIDKQYSSLIPDKFLAVYDFPGDPNRSVYSAEEPTIERILKRKKPRVHTVEFDKKLHEIIFI